jgi:hypothetical protein
MPKFCYDSKHKLPCRQPCQKCNKFCDPKKIQTVLGPRAKGRLANISNRAGGDKK